MLETRLEVLGLGRLCPVLVLNPEELTVELGNGVVDEGGSADKVLGPLLESDVLTRELELRVAENELMPLFVVPVPDVVTGNELGAPVLVVNVDRVV